MPFHQKEISNHSNTAGLEIFGKKIISRMKRSLSNSNGPLSR
jgi:hypothetical protein